MNLENCPICSLDTFEHVYDLEDYRISKEPFSLQKCTNCSFIFTLGIPASSNISKYYESEDYLEHSNKKSDLFSRFYGWARDIMLKYKFRVLKDFSSEGNILDIGAGSGQFLNFMSKKGFDVTGIEMSEKARQYARQNFGLKLYPQEYLYSKEIEKEYDIVSLWHVLEHLYDLEKVIVRFNELLKPDGCLILALPNHNSFDAKHYRNYWAAWDVPRHLWHFSPNSLKELLKRHHLKILDMKMMPMDPFYNSLLSENYKNKGSILNIVRAFGIGIISVFIGFFNVNKASSVIYIIKKEQKTC